MAEIELNNLSKAELIALQRQVESAIAQHQQVAIGEAPN